MKKHNFSAGPSILPASVFEKSAQAVIDFNQSGLSILEISHRSKEFIDVMQEARQLALEIAGLENKGYEALFLHGGASLQFLMHALNLLKRKGAYVDTGTWASKAYKEAKLVGEAVVVASSKENGYKHIPQNIYAGKEYDYLHITTNNTIYGTQFEMLPKVEIPLVADMSSDIFSKEFPYEKMGLIYAGAQKNLGAAGVTLVIVRKDLLGKVNRTIPTMLNYEAHIAAQSMTNTPAVFAIYTCLLNLQWIKAQGGLKAMQERNNKKATLLYNEIDRNPLVKGYAQINSRSKMNVVFNLENEAHSERFDALCKKADISGIKGHRSVGGYRASIYNAMEEQSVKVLVDVLKEFEQKI